MNSQPVYNPQTLYFHYFSIDIPADIDQDKSINEANIFGNRFYAYPIESQQAFTKHVQGVINVFKSHKLSQTALEYERVEREETEELGLDYIKKSHPPLNMTTALYKAIKYDENTYNIIANPLSNLDSTFNSVMYSQWYIYIPEQHKYIMTKQTMFPARFLVSRDQVKTGRTFLDTQIRPLTPQSLANPKHMAVGPIAWIDANFHPKIDYYLVSKQYPMSISLEVEGYRKDERNPIKTEQKDDLEEYKDSNEGKANRLDSGSRTVVGIKGREVCYYFPLSQYSESAYIWCSWGTNGKKEDLNHPFIKLDMFYNVDGTESSRNTAMQAWEQLLGSFKRRGHG